MTTRNILTDLGWNAFFAGAFRNLGSPELVPARVVTQHKRILQVKSEHGEMAATVSGRLYYHAQETNLYPVTGDWVAVQVLADENKGVIQAVLPRKSSFSRQVAGGRKRLSGGLAMEQVVAANIDTAFLVGGLDGGRNLNLKRLERYLVLARGSDASPVIVMNKVDLCPDVESRILEIERIAPDTPVHAVSALAGTGLGELRTYLVPGNTAALLGPSGVGKSAIINALCGRERQAVGAVRESDLRGRHTTTRRELISLPGGSNVIDTPGLREIQVWSNAGQLEETFGDIETIASLCRFNDCRHDEEPGCAVREAIASGELDPERLRNYEKLKRDLRHQEARLDNHARLEEKAKWKKIAQLSKEMQKVHRNRDY